MLRTNTKKARENVREYIRSNLEGLREYIDIDDSATDREILAGLYDEFLIEFGYEVKRGRSYQEAFIEWAQGLPCGSIFDYYYHRDAVEIVGDILEETEEERARFDEDAAAHLLTYLIYSETLKAYEL